MVQFWSIINIDKEEGWDEIAGNAKWGELYFFFSQCDLYTLASGNRWAGDRIMLMGDHTEFFPPGILTVEEAKDLDVTEFDVFHISCEVPVNKVFSSGENTIALRNLNSREYITNRLFPGKSSYEFLSPCQTFHVH
jgi:hypothetical protein